MASTTYNTQVCFRDLTKTYHLGNANKMVTKCHRFATLGNMVRNACGCESSILSFLLTGTAAVVNNMAVAVEKL